MSPGGPLASDRVLGFADRHRRWLPPALGLFFLAFCTGRWRPEPDGAVALTVGRSIARGTGFAHPDGLDAPLSLALPHVAAWGFGVFGPDSVLLPLAVIAACWFLGLWLCYLLVRDTAGRPTAVVVTGLLGVSESWVSYGLAVRTDLPFATGVLAVLLGAAWLAARRKVAGGLLLFAGLSLAALTRSVWVVVAAALAVTFGLHLLREKRWRLLLALGLSLPAAAAVAWFCSAALRDDASMLAHRMTRGLGAELGRALTERLPALFTESFPEAVFALDVGPIATGVTSVLLVAGLLLAATRPLRPLWLILPALFVLQWMAFTVHDRYVLPLLVLLLLGWWTLAVRLEGVGARSEIPLIGALLRWSVPAALVAAIGMNIAGLVEVFAEQRSSDPLTVYAGGRYEPATQAGAWLRTHTPADAVVLTENHDATVLAFLADRRVLSGRELEKVSTPITAPLFAYEPLDGRARRAAEAAGWSPGETVWESDAGPARSLRVMMAP